MSIGEEADEGKLQAWFCEGHGKSLTLMNRNLLTKRRDLDMSIRHNKFSLIEVNDIKKKFGGVIALNGVKFELKPGEVHALLGENGAGKSTLIKIICGVINPDSGVIKIKGESIKNLTPSLARNLGISTVFQELSLIDELTIKENVFLGREFTSKGILEKSKISDETKKLLAYMNLSLDPKTKVKELGAAQKQLVEIAKALSTNPEIIIMDEPTDKLYGDEQEKLFELIKRMREEGKGIIYISHKLEELPIIADRVTVLRDGSYVDTFEIKNTTKEDLIKSMVGRELKDMFPKENIGLGEEIFRVENLSYNNFIKDISFTVRKGEILGLGGLVGSGRTLLAKNLSGILKCTLGKITLNGKEIDTSSPAKTIKNGIVYLPEDRKANGLIMSMSVFDNIILPVLSNIFLNKKKMNSDVSRLIEKLKIKTPSEKTIVENLSGGNQQKVVIAKWLHTNAKVFIFDEPTQGIDVGTKVEIYKLMNQLVKNGACIIMISSDMRELLAMSDRIAVMQKGRISGILNREECTQENILSKAMLKNNRD